MFLHCSRQCMLLFVLCVSYFKKQGLQQNMHVMYGVSSLALMRVCHGWESILDIKKILPTSCLDKPFPECQGCPKADLSFSDYNVFKKCWDVTVATTAFYLEGNLFESQRVRTFRDFPHPLGMNSKKSALIRAVSYRTDKQCQEQCLNILCMDVSVSFMIVWVVNSRNTNGALVIRLVETAFLA
jgi:hypothetical protein